MKIIISNLLFISLFMSNLWADTISIKTVTGEYVEVEEEEIDRIIEFRIKTLGDKKLQKKLEVVQFNEGKICATATPSKVTFQIYGRADSLAECWYKKNGEYSFSRFSTSSTTYDTTSKRWSCVEWTKGNPDYDIKITMDAKDYLTNENSALGTPCP